MKKHQILDGKKAEKRPDHECHTYHFQVTETPSSCKMSGRVRTRVDRGTGEVVAYSDAAVRNNLAVIEYCRTSMAALSGATAGMYVYGVMISLFYMRSFGEFYVVTGRLFILICFFNNNLWCGLTQGILPCNICDKERC